jgi:hypothetical protein
MSVEVSDTFARSLRAGARCPQAFFTVASKPPKQPPNAVLDGFDFKKRLKFIFLT